MNCYDCDYFGTLEEKEGMYCADKKEIIEDTKGCGNLKQSKASKIIHEMDKEIKLKNLSKTKKLLQY